MKAVLISMQPFYVYLIIARVVGWEIPREKTLEVRKSFPKDHAWIGITHIYCCKNRKSFSRIPVQYQPIMEKFLGKVIGEFVCDKIEFIVHGLRIFDEHDAFNKALEMACLSVDEFDRYATPYPELLKNYGTYATQYHADCFRAYGWHISELKIYDKPKELGEFLPYCKGRGCCDGGAVWDGNKWHYGVTCGYSTKNCFGLTRPPQSWCYVEELNED